MSRKLGIFFALFLLLCCVKYNAPNDPNNTVNETVQIWIAENVNKCQRKGIKKSLIFLEKKWNSENNFKFYGFKKNKNKINLDKVPWRTIVVTAHDKNDVKVHGVKKTATAIFKFGKIKNTNKKVFKGHIKFILQYCCMPEVYKHELGHVFGLKHRNDKKNIMNEKVFSGSVFDHVQIRNMKKVALSL